MRVQDVRFRAKGFGAWGFRFGLRLERLITFESNQSTLHKGK